MDVAGVEPVEVDVEGFGVGFGEGDGVVFGGFEEVLQDGGVFGEDVCVGVEGCLVGCCCEFGVLEFDGGHGACGAGGGC